MIAGAVAAAACFPSAAAAQAQQALTRAAVSNDLSSTFTIADTDKNGSLSKAEIAAAEAKVVQGRLAQMRARVEEEFGRADTDKNGSLSKAEFMAVAVPKGPATPPTGAEMLAELDKNKDGKVSLAEFRDPQLAGFDALDTNKDGTLSDAERQAAANR
jgi:Ca2+-binding EF-hand superfamily protein